MTVALIRIITYCAQRAVLDIPERELWVAAKSVRMNILGWRRCGTPRGSSFVADL